LSKENSNRFTNAKSSCLTNNTVRQQSANCGPSTLFTGLHVRNTYSCGPCGMQGLKCFAGCVGWNIC